MRLTDVGLSRRTLLCALSACCLAGCDGAAQAAEAQPGPETEPSTPPVPPTQSVREVGTRATVYLVSLGPFDAATLDAIARNLEDELQVEVKRLGRKPLPKSAWYAPRKRFRADIILDHLPTLIPGEPESTRILALTQKDISTTKGKFKDWGVFGLGNMPGQAAVVSNYRLKRKAKGSRHLRRRIVNTAIHEVGHMLGLPHCTEHEARCPMQDAEGSIANTDASTGHLGPRCRADLERKLPATRVSRIGS
ncbi:MAG: hypothetical protein ACRBN8_42870 [Nannocystales bacterium]